MVEEEVELEAGDGYLRGQVSDFQGFIELLKLFRGEVFGVEAVLTGVMVAGLAAVLALDVVERTLRRIFGSWGAV